MFIVLCYTNLFRLKIMKLYTINSFYQELLRRFVIENFLLGTSVLSVVREKTN